jgi:NADH:ubiquinone oxidoreductase subunit
MNLSGRTGFMSIFSELFCWWHGQTLGTRLFTLRRGAFVGTDSTGNRYYEERRPRPGSTPRRWVLYNGEAEASRVPPEWHVWLHHTVAEPPTREPLPVKPWEQPHRPNLTGTEAAYHPPGSLYRPGTRAPEPRAYEAWVPD